MKDEFVICGNCGVVHILFVCEKYTENCLGVMNCTGCGRNLDYYDKRMVK